MKVQLDLAVMGCHRLHMYINASHLSITCRDPSVLMSTDNSALRIIFIGQNLSRYLTVINLSQCIRVECIRVFSNRRFGNFILRLSCMIKRTKMSVVMPWSKLDESTFDSQP